MTKVIVFTSFKSHLTIIELNPRIRLLGHSAFFNQLRDNIKKATTDINRLSPWVGVRGLELPTSTSRKNVAGAEDSYFAP